MSTRSLFAATEVRADVRAALLGGYLRLDSRALAFFEFDALSGLIGLRLVLIPLLAIPIQMLLAIPVPLSIWFRRHQTK